MWPDDCWRLDWLRHQARHAFNQGLVYSGRNFVERLMEACRVLGVNVGAVGSAADVQVAVQRAKDRLNKKWVPQ